MQAFCKDEPEVFVITFYFFWITSLFSYSFQAKLLDLAV